MVGSASRDDRILPLTRVVAAIVISAARVVLGTVAIGLVLLLVAVGRAWHEFDHSNPLSYLYVAGLAGTLGVIGVLSVWMRSERRQLDGDGVGERRVALR